MRVVIGYEVHGLDLDGNMVVTVVKKGSYVVCVKIVDAKGAANRPSADKYPVQIQHIEAFCRDAEQGLPARLAAEAAIALQCAVAYLVSTGKSNPIGGKIKILVKITKHDVPLSPEILFFVKVFGKSDLQVIGTQSLVR